MTDRTVSHDRVLQRIGGGGMGTVYTFLGLTVGLSSVFYLLIISSGRLGAGGGLYVYGLMWCPGLAALITCLIHQGNLRGLGWGWGRTRDQLLSIAIPILYALAAYGATWLTGLGGFYDRALVAKVARQLAGHLGMGEPSPALALALFVVGIAVLNAVPECFAALGEEIGWRGFLVPQLAKRASFTRTALLSGAIWSLWHYPILLFADYNSGTGWYGLACFTLMVLSISFVFAWMRLRSGSLWTGMFLHASHNLFIQNVFDRLTIDTGPTRYVIGEFGVALVLSGLAAAYLCWRKRNELPGSA